MRLKGFILNNRLVKFTFFSTKSDAIKYCHVNNYPLTWVMEGEIEINNVNK